MSLIDDFIASPSVEILSQCTNAQLLELSEKYQVPLSNAVKRLKDTTLVALIEGLVAQELLPETAADAKPPQSSTKELEIQICLQELTLREKELDYKHEHEKLRVSARQEQLKNTLELKRMEYESRKWSQAVPRDGFQVSRYIKMVPDFTGKEVEKYFPNFERVAITLEWPKQYWTLLLQCVLKGRAQEVYSVLPLEDSADYDKVKAAILDAYQLVPEAYRQKFRHFKRTERQTYVEFAAEETTLFDRWCQSEGVNSMGKLKELILIEDFRNSLPDNVSIYVAEQKAETSSQAACLADQYALTQRVYKDRYRVKSQSPAFNYFYKTPRPFNSRIQSPSDSKSPSVPVETEQRFCNYCKISGHLKSECIKLKKRQEKSVGLVTTARQNSLSLKPVGTALVKAPSTYEPFLTDGIISVADGQSAPVRILRDTGAAQSFILRDFLPLSEKNATGRSVLVQGIEMGIMKVPLHRVRLKSDLVCGDVVVGVRSSFPIPSVNFILGNDIGGWKVWSGGEELPEVIAAPPAPVGMDDRAQRFPDVFPASAVTRAQRKKLNCFSR